MKNFDIEKYLDGKMSEQELDALKSEMEQNPDFANEVRMAELLAEDIDMQSTRNELNEIIKSGKKKRNGKWIPILVLFFGVCAGGYYFLNTAHNKPTPSETTSTSEAIQPTEEKVLKKFDESNKNSQIKLETKKETPPIKKKEKKKPIPIAKNNSNNELSPPLFPSPKLRGQNDKNEDWHKMLDQIWYTKFPPANTSFSETYAEAAELLKERKFTKAFTKLEILGFKIPKNDTLFYLKGYCLTEMGEGGDALRNFRSIKNPPEAWVGNIEWHSALSILIAEGVEAALPSFREIEKNKNHLFQNESKYVIKVLVDNF